MFIRNEPDIFCFMSNDSNPALSLHRTFSVQGRPKRRYPNDIKRLVLCEMRELTPKIGSAKGVPHVYLTRFPSLYSNFLLFGNPII